MKDSVFRAYDIRGIVGKELIIDEVYNLGRAIVFYLEEKYSLLQTVAIGIDGRLHSSVIKDELVRAFRISGINVIFVNMCTTPVIYFSEYWLQVDAAFMITASHNSKEWNGIKISLHKQCLMPEDIQNIKMYYQQKKYIISDIIGSYSEYDLVADYVDYLVRLFPHLVESDYSIAFDCGNASVGLIMNQLVKKMKWKKALLLYEKVDGNYPHHTADPTLLENMKDLLLLIQKTNIAIGIGFDGDADRMGVITDKGILLSGDVILSGWARKIGMSSCEKDKKTVVYDIKCSDALAEVINKSGLNPIVSPSGHSFIKQYIKQYNALLAGELSCHFFFNDRYFGFDDGVYAALRLLELITTYTTSLNAILSDFPSRKNSPELRIECKQDSTMIVNGVKRYFENKKNHKIIEIDGIKVDTGKGWGLIRSSNTQPVVCLRFEGHSSEDLLYIKEEFIKALEPYFSKEFLFEQVTW